MRKNRTEKRKLICKLLKEWSDRFKRWFKNMTIVRPFWVTVGISVILFLFAFVFRRVLITLKDILHTVRGIIGEGFLPSVRADQGIDTWFAFFGSYFGVIATVALGIITLRFSFRLGQREQVTKVGGIKIKEMYLYDMSSDYAPSQWKHSDTRKYRFLLKIVLTEYDPIYKFDIDQVLWGNCSKDYINSDSRTLSDYKAHVDNAGNVIIYVYFNEFDLGKNLTKEKLENTVSYFYHIQEYVPLLLERHERCRWIEIDMKLTEKTWIKGQQPDMFWIKFSILFENSQKLEDCVELHEVIHEIEISNAPYGKNR